MERYDSRARPRNMSGMSRMAHMKRFGAAIAAAGAVALTGCGNGGDDTTAVPEEAGDSGASLTGTAWRVQMVQVGEASTEAPDDTEAVLGINDGTIGGNTGCNAFSGDVEVNETESTIVVSDVISTMRACMDERGEIDRAMLGMLHGELAVEIDGDQLTLTGAEGDQLTFRATDQELDLDDEVVKRGNGDNNDQDGEADED